MGTITDTDEVPVTYLSYSLPESSDSAVFTLLIPCLEGQVLKADTNADVSIFGRVSGVGTYVDLAVSPISLDPYAGTQQAFDLYIHTNAVTGIVSTAVGLRAGSP